MKISLEQLKKLEPLQRVIIQSLDLSLYRVVVEQNGETYWLVDNQGSPLKLHSLMETREILDGYHIQELVMQHQSAYYEMVGQPLRESNLLEVPIGKDLYPVPKTLN